MSHVKTTSYIDAITRELREEHIADIKATLEVIDEHFEQLEKDIQRERREVSELIQEIYQRLYVLERGGGGVG